MYNNYYWDAKTKFELNFKSIRRISGLSINTISNDNMLKLSRLTKVEDGLAQFSHDEFTMLVWYMSRIAPIRDLMVEYRLALEEYRKEVIPEKYVTNKISDSHYYRQGHLSNKFVKYTIESDLI